MLKGLGRDKQQGPPLKLIAVAGGLTPTTEESTAGASSASPETELPPSAPLAKIAGKPELADAQKAGPMTDSAKDFTAEELMPAPSLTSAGSQALDALTEPDTPRSGHGLGAPRRASGISKLFINTFRRSSAANKQRYVQCHLIPKSG